MIHLLLHSVKPRNLNQDEITKNFQIFKNKGLEYTQKKQLRALMYWKYIGPVPNSLAIFIIFPHGQKMRQGRTPFTQWL